MAKIPTICVCGNELEKSFRKICNEILREIWQNTGYKSDTDWKYEFNSVICEHYGNYHWYKSGYFSSLSELTMDMVRKLYRELNIVV